MTLENRGRRTLSVEHIPHVRGYECGLETGRKRHPEDASSVGSVKTVSNRRAPEADSEASTLNLCCVSS